MPRRQVVKRGRWVVGDCIVFLAKTLSKPRSLARIASDLAQGRYHMGPVFNGIHRV